MTNNVVLTLGAADEKRFIWDILEGDDKPPVFTFRLEDRRNWAKK